MNGAETGTSQHRDGGLGHHRHVDHHAVAPLDAQGGQGAGHAGGPVQHLGIGDVADDALHGAVPDQGILITPPRGDVAIEAIEGGIEHAAREPAPVGTGCRVEHLVRRPIPIQTHRGLAPPCRRVSHCSVIGLRIALGHCRLPRRRLVGHLRECFTGSGRAATGYSLLYWIRCSSRWIASRVCSKVIVGC